MSTNRKYLDLNGLAYYHSKIISDIEHKIPEIPDIIVNLKLFATELHLGNKPIKYINTATENMAGLMSPNDVSKLKECLRFQYVDEIEHHEATINDFDPGELIAQSRDNLYKIYLDKVTDNGYNAYVIKLDENLNWKFVKIGSTSANEDFILKTSTGSQGLIYIKTDSFKVGSATGSIDLEIVEGDYPINLIGTDKINLYGNSLTLNGKNIVSKLDSINCFGNPGDTFTVYSSTPILRKKSDSESYQVWDKLNLAYPLREQEVKINDKFLYNGFSLKIPTALSSYQIWNSDQSSSLASGDTFLKAFSKLEKRIVDLENGNPGPGPGPSSETDPTVPAWAKTTNKPSYTAVEVGAIPSTDKPSLQNKIESITLNGNSVPITNKTANITGVVTGASNGLKIENNIVKHSNHSITPSTGKKLYSILFDEFGHIVDYEEIVVLDLVEMLSDYFAPNENLPATIPATSITISGNSTLNLGDSETLYVNVNPSNTTDTITWTSSDDSIVSVVPASNGRSATITALQSSNSPVTITVTAGNVSNNIDITVNSEAYYWYVGTTKPTSLSQAQTVPSYPAEQTYTNNSGAKSKIYVLTNSDKNVTMIDPGLGGTIDQDNVDTTTISGCKIYSTYSRIANTGTILVRIS